MPTPISNELLSESCKSQKYKESLFDKKATVERTGRATCTLTCSFGLTDVPGAGWEMITFCPNASVARMKTRTAWRSFDIIVRVRVQGRGDCYIENKEEGLGTILYRRVQAQRIVVYTLQHSRALLLLPPVRIHKVLLKLRSRLSYYRRTRYEMPVLVRAIDEYQTRQ